MASSKLLKRSFAPLSLAVFLFASCLAAANESAPVWRELKPEEIISAEELRALQTDKKDFLLFDARNKRDYDLAHIQGAALPLPVRYYNDLALYNANVIADKPDTAVFLSEAMKAVPLQKPIVTYCNANCQSSTAVLLKLKALGFTDVRVMKEGLQGWEAGGYPVERAS